MTRMTTTAVTALPKRASNAILRAGIKSTDLTDDQRQRAITCEKVKAGLTGKALANWILTGDSRTDPVAPGDVTATEHPAATPQKKDRQNMTTPTGDTATPKPRKRRENSAMLMVEQALTETGRPMHLRAITEIVLERNTALPADQRPLKGKTPANTISAQVATISRDGGFLEKVAPGVFALRAWDDATKRQDPVIPDGIRGRKPATA